MDEVETQVVGDYLMQNLKESETAAMEDLLGQSQGFIFHD